MEKVRKHGDIKLVTTESKRNYLVRTKLSYYKVFHKPFVSYKNEKNPNTQ